MSKPKTKEEWVEMHPTCGKVDCLKAVLLAQENENGELYNKIDQIIGDYYEFEGMCPWAREEDPAPPFCYHEGCHKAQGINMRQAQIRREIKELLL